MQIPESYYGWIFASVGIPKFHATYDSQGRVVLEDVAPTTAKDLTSCVCAGSGSGAFAKRLNGIWYCQ